MTWKSGVAGLVSVAVLSLGPLPARGQGFVPIAEAGFGDCQNTFSWSMAWFRDRLLVGTSRGSVIGPGGDPSLCPIVDDAAQIWSFDPEDGLWSLVYSSPRDVPAPSGIPGPLARDNGFRDMIVFVEGDGTEALYVAGVLFPVEGEPRRPRILRSTDGVVFEPLPQDPGTFLGDLDAEGFRAMAVFEERLYVTAGTTLGEGVILEASEPVSGNDAFRRVSPPGQRIFELEVFDGQLYAGSGEPAGSGFSVSRTAATGAPPYAFVEVVGSGGYPECKPLRKLLTLCPNTTVLSMEVFQGSLYVGGNTDVLRIETDDTWDVIVGDARQTPQGLKEPLSGRGSGFGNFFTAHVWRLEVHGNELYAGTWDAGTLLRNVPFIGLFASRQAGFDLWKTVDGASWRRVTKSGFGRPFNHGVRSLVSTPAGLFVGTVNPWEGTDVWQLR